MILSLLLVALQAPPDPIVQTCRVQKVLAGPVHKVRQGADQTFTFTDQRPGWILPFELELFDGELERVRLTMDGETTLILEANVTANGSVLADRRYALATIDPQNDILLMLPQQLLALAAGDPKGPLWQSVTTTTIVESSRSVDIVDPSDLEEFEGRGFATFHAAGDLAPGGSVTCQGSCAYSVTTLQTLDVTVAYFPAAP